MEFFDSVEGGENVHGQGYFRGLGKEETVFELLGAKNLHFVKDKGLPLGVYFTQNKMEVQRSEV